MSKRISKRDVDTVLLYLNDEADKELNAAGAVLSNPPLARECIAAAEAYIQAQQVIIEVLDV